MIETFATKMESFFMHMVNEQRRFAHGARVLAEKHEGWLVVAAHCDRRAAAAQRMLDDLPILTAWRGFETLVEPISQSMLDAWNKDYGPPGSQDAGELHRIGLAFRGPTEVAP